MYLIGLNTVEKMAFYSLAKFLAEADDGILPEEQEVLDLFKQELGIPEQEPTMEIEEACLAFSSIQIKRIVLLELLLLAYSDGSIGKNEENLLSKLSSLLDITSSQYQSAETWAQGMNALNRSGLRFIRGGK